MFTSCRSQNCEIKLQKVVFIGVDLLSNCTLIWSCIKCHGFYVCMCNGLYNLLHTHAQRWLKTTWAVCLSRRVRSSARVWRQWCAAATSTCWLYPVASHAISLNCESRARAGLGFMLMQGFLSGCIWVSDELALSVAIDTWMGICLFRCLKSSQHSNSCSWCECQIQHYVTFTFIDIAFIFKCQLTGGAFPKSIVS